jgi:outer membrane protein OmpA-like peptidoglycan-associated protein
VAKIDLFALIRLASLTSKPMHTATIKKMNTSPIFLKVWFLALGVLLLGLSSHAQEVPTFSDPEKLQDWIDCEIEEGIPVVTPEDQLLYFIRSFYNTAGNGSYAGTLNVRDIWDGRDPRKNEMLDLYNNFPYCGNRATNAVIGIGDDGTIFLLNKLKSPNSNFEGVFTSKLENDKWSKPMPAPIKNFNPKKVYGFFMNATLDVLIISMEVKGGFGEKDLYISLKDYDGNWSEPENMGATINTEGYEIAPFLSKDNKTLYFASNGHKGYGSADIFMTTRLYDSWKVWSKPVNLGPQINSERFDAYFNLHNDTTAYFISNRSPSSIDIYTTTLDQPKAPDPTPYNPVEATLGNPLPALADVIRSNSNIPMDNQELEAYFGHPIETKIFFEESSHELTPASVEFLWFISNKILADSNIKLRFIGFLSEDERYLDNLTLPRRRAVVTSNYVRSLGISRDRLTVAEKHDSVGDQEIPKGKVEIQFFKE